MAIAPVAVSDVFRVVYFQTLFEQRVLTVLHMVCTGAPTGSTEYITAADNLAIRMADETKFPLDTWRAVVCAQLSFDQVRVQRVHPTREVYMEQNIGVVGTHAGTCTTANVAMSVEKRSLRVGRKGIGRIQMAGVPSEEIVDGRFDLAYVGAVHDVWNNLPDEITNVLDGSKWRFVLWGGDSPTVDDWIFDVNTFDTVRTMHRRTLRVGE